MEKKRTITIEVTGYDNGDLRAFEAHFTRYVRRLPSVSDPEFQSVKTTVDGKVVAEQCWGPWT